MGHLKSERKRLSHKEWEAVLKEQKESGETQVNFCRERGISLRSFEKKRAVIKRQRSRDKFVEIKPKIEGANWRYEIELPCGAIFRGN